LLIGIGKNVILKYRMPSFDFVQTIVSAFVLVFLLANIVMHFMKMFKEGFEGETNNTTEAPPSQIDYASQISINMSDLFEKVNKQLEITKTIKIPISTDTITISYNRNLATNMIVYGNLLTLINDGIMRVEEYLKNVQTYQYIGNSSIQKMSDELAKINETTVLANCNSSSATSDDCLRKNEYDMIQRVMVIVDSHQKTIDKILEKRAANE